MLIGITGYARHGKDSIANLLVEKFGFTKLGFADAVREMAEAIDPPIRTGAKHYALADGTTDYKELLRAVGYEQAKQNPEVRRLLQRIGTEAGRDVLGDDVWVRALEHKFCQLDPETNVVICDVRFENEANMVKNWGGYLIRVTRPNFDNGLPAVHPSEQSIATLDVDFDIIAEGFDELLAKAEDAYLALNERREAALDIVRRTAPTPVGPRVYLAAPWVHKDDAMDAKLRLIAAGIDVVSGWTERENSQQEVNPAEMQRQAILDREEVDAANTIVVLGLAKSEGKACELGMSLAQHKRIIVVKDNREGNIFYHLPEVELVPTLDAAIALLTGGYTSTVFSANDAKPNPLGILVPTTEPSDNPVDAANASKS